MPAPQVVEALARSYQQWRRAIAGGAVRKGLVDQTLVETHLDTPADRKAQDRAFRELHVTSIMAARMAGLKPAEIAAQFQISRGAVTAYLAEAQRNGLLDAAKDMLVGSLMPKALATYATHLEQHNLEAARDVLTSVGVINTKGPAQGLLPPGSEGEFTLTQIRARLSSKQTPVASAPEVASGDIIDVLPDSGLQFLEETLAGESADIATQSPE